MKIRLVGAELLRADRLTNGETERWVDGQTDMTKLIVAFANLRTCLKTELNVSSLAF